MMIRNKKVIIILGAIIVVVVIAIAISSQKKSPISQSSKLAENTVVTIQTPENIKPSAQKDGVTNIELLKQVNLYGADKPAQYGRMSFFENNQWVVIPIRATSGSGEGYIAVLNYQNGKWAQIVDGPGYTISDVANLAPESVATYYAALELGNGQ